MATTPFIRVKDVTKIYGDTAVVDSVSFDIEKGSILAIIGPNGAGKSTMLKIIMGLLDPTSGDVSIDGKRPRDVRTRMGYVPQRFQFDEWLPMTVHEFLELSAHVSGVHDSEEDQLIRERLADVGVPDVGGKMLSQLSGGQLQRVMIARALLTQKDILLLDEPVAGIDVEGQRAMYELITDINREQGTTCILISHELDVVFRYATNVLCLNKKMLCHGLPKEAMTDDVLAEMYGHHTAHYHHELEHDCDIAQKRKNT